MIWLLFVVVVAAAYCVLARTLQDDETWYWLSEGDKETRNAKLLDIAKKAE